MPLGIASLASALRDQRVHGGVPGFATTCTTDSWISVEALLTARATRTWSASAASPWAGPTPMRLATLARRLLPEVRASIMGGPARHLFPGPRPGQPGNVDVVVLGEGEDHHRSNWPGACFEGPDGRSLRERILSRELDNVLGIAFLRARPCAPDPAQGKRHRPGRAWPSRPTTPLTSPCTSPRRFPKNIRSLTGNPHAHDLARLSRSTAASAR